MDGRETGNGRTGGTIRAALLALAAVGGGLLGGTSPVGAQEEEEEYVPVIPQGVPVVVLPVQAATPTPGGMWPGGEATMQETLDRLEAELAFAFGEERGAEGWALPDRVVERARRNPMLRVDPSRLAYQGLLKEPESGSELYEPLHGQLRKVAALFGARLIVLPLALSWEREVVEEAAEEDAAEGEGAPVRASGRGRATLLLALIDIRRSAVLWHGTLEGEVATPDSPATLATLAARVARQLSPS